MTLVTVDLDNTLIRTHQFYDNAIDNLAVLLDLYEDIDPEETKEVLNRIDSKLVEKYGVQKHRFPESFIRTTKELVPEASDRLLKQAEDLAYDTYKKEPHYRVQGFIRGSEDMIRELQEDYATQLHLVTVGDTEVQQPKIDALGLDNFFDDIHVCTYTDGKESVFREILETHGYGPEEFYHIGDSASSDITPAINLGGNAVYISDEPDWLSNQEDHNELVEDEHVNHFSSQLQFVKNMNTVFNE
jgi:FMN phosphatase YigB (HAD superfamily)